jgi:predicted RNA-binding protein with RPS1 domain
LKTCPVCELEISESIPSFCPQCGWDLRNDPTLVPSLDNIPDEFLEDYRQRLKITRGNWKQNQNLVARLEKLENQIVFLQKLFKIHDKALRKEEVLDKYYEYFFGIWVERLESEMYNKKWDMIIEEYHCGDTIEATITDITDSGIFISLYKGIEGFIDKSDISWTEGVKHPSQFYKIGQRVQAIIYDYDKEFETIRLSIKFLESCPWHELESYRALNLKSRRDLKEDEGLDEYLVDIRLLKLQGHTYKRSYDMISDKYPVGTTVEATITDITDLGISIYIKPCIEGFIDRSYMSRYERIIEHPSEFYKIGQTVQAIVLFIDKKAERIWIGIKKSERCSQDDE